MSSILNARRTSFRSLCWLMAVVTGMAPTAAVWAQQPNNLPAAEAAADLTAVLPGSCLVILAKPRQLLTSDMLQMFPIEVLSAAAIQETGLDPVNAQQLVISVMPPVMGPPNFAVSAKFTGPVQLKASPRLTGHTAPGEIGGQAYLKSQHPMLPSIYQPDASSLLLAPDVTLGQLLRDGQANTDSVFTAHLQKMSGDDLAAIIDLQPLQPLIQMGLAQVEADPNLPPEVQPFLEAPQLIRLVKLRLNFTGHGPSELVVEANNTADADKLSGLVDQARKMWRDGMLKKAEELLASEDPVEQALGRYQMRMSDAMEAQFKPTREGNSLVIFRYEVGEGNGALTQTAIIGVLVALLLPATQAAREAARRNASLNNLKQIMLGLHMYADRHKGHFPAHANYGENGKPLLSWRVHILPYVEQQALYGQFHLDEPWDSEHNRQLIPLMPEIYLDPSSGLSREEGKTSYLGSAGEGALFNGTEKGVSFAQIRDGTSNTIAVLQVDDKRAAVWTKPEDWQSDPKQPLNGLGGLHPGVFQAARADGSVFTISEAIDVETFKKMLTIAGGELVDAF